MDNMFKHHNGSGKRLRHFLLGCGSILDIMPAAEGLASYKLQDFCIVNDKQAMYSDWSTVGNDFKKAFQTEIADQNI